ncbi:helix-turn-helix domain-containing protein [Desulfonema magnum]|uniref:DNA-binding HTH domain-containing protein, LuxR-type n=1 Tax=Desulfonema magnum TaxID=45655 RepID=A0A975BHH6_9BACT|nr:helix-turn-helix transcriptional regulator [Desulfonema magnum]QTA85461.1 DNA-binding HTH domain-containing protein, LuxR-type [Desulfonema magnum]
MNTASVCEEFDQWLRGLEKKTATSKPVRSELFDIRQTEKSLRKKYDELRRHTAFLSSELSKANEELQQEVYKRKIAEKSLRKKEKELESQSDHLKELNTTLNVLLEKLEKDKHEIENNILSNVKELVAPYLERLKKSRLNNNQKAIVSVLESNLIHIVSPFIRNVSSKSLNFTPMEIQVANLVRQGRTNKEIANFLRLSVHTILTHRHNIRNKLGLKNKKINLRSQLISLTQH